MAGGIEELSRYRFSRAKEELDNARGVFEEGKYKMALNRSYYSMFHAMRSVNVLDEFDSSKHSGVIAHFNQYRICGVFYNIESFRRRQHHVSSRYLCGLYSSCF